MEPIEMETGRQRIARAGLAITLLALGLYTLQNFLTALAWAAVFAIAIWPLFSRAERRYPPGRHNLLLPSLFTLAVALVFIVPLALAGLQLKDDMLGALHWVRDVQHDGLPVPAWLDRLPTGGNQARAWWQRNLATPSSTANFAGKLELDDAVSITRQIGAQLLHRTVSFGFTLLTLFFLFRHGAGLASEMLRASERLFGPRGERIGRQMIASVHGTVSGLVLVGLGEGVLLGVAYTLAGVPRAALLGGITAIAAMIPFGAIIAYGGASLLVLAQGHIAAAAAVFMFGSAVLFIADHLVRPFLIGGAIRLPFLWVLLGILGGVEQWGLVGLFIGPAIMAALILLWRELTENQTVPLVPSVPALETCP